MNLAYFSLLLCLPILYGYPTVRGSDSGIQCIGCTEQNREECHANENWCGNCLGGYYEDTNNICQKSGSNEDSDWKYDSGGSDGTGSEITTIFDDLEKPTTAPATGVENQNGLPVSDQQFHKNNEAKIEEAKKIKNDLNGDIGSHEKSPIQKDEISRKLKIKNDKLLEARRKAQEKREEEKLNKFMGEREDKGAKDGKTLAEEQRETNLQINSSTNPPPYIKKHKVGKNQDHTGLEDLYFLFIVIGCSVAGIAGLALAGYCWYKLHTTAKAVSEAEYTGYAMKGSTKQPPQTHGDQKLDYSAEMYHYQQTKSQLAAMEKAGATSPKGGAIDDDENSDEGDEGDYTVYECPGLAPTGDMTVVNPMFSDQEAIGSDQDANGGDRSGHSSPSAPRHPISQPPE